MVVRRLAKRYGARLLDQRGRGVVLTEAGVELYRHALGTLRSAYDLEARIRALDVGKGLIILATRQALSAHFLPPSWWTFGGNIPALRFGFETSFRG